MVLKFLIRIIYWVYELRNSSVYLNYKRQVLCQQIDYKNKRTRVFKTFLLTGLVSGTLVVIFGFVSLVIYFSICFSRQQRHCARVSRVIVHLALQATIGVVLGFRARLRKFLHAPHIRSCLLSLYFCHLIEESLLSHVDIVIYLNFIGKSVFSIGLNKIVCIICYFGEELQPHCYKQTFRLDLKT